MSEVETMSPAEFLLARIAEDEAAAREAGGGTWDAKWGGEIVAGYGSPMDGEQLGDVVDRVTAAHIARHDPARVLAECEAKRRIVELHGGGEFHVDPCDAHDPSGHTIPCDTLHALALPYADHPDYDPT